MTASGKPEFHEFFSGGGMARLGLAPHWVCTFSNDFDPVKRAAYVENFGDNPDPSNVWDLNARDLPGTPDLVWASPPCQDLSVAGKRTGLGGDRSSAFFGFWTLIMALRAKRRAPGLIVLENVTGLLNSHGGADFIALCQAFANGGYRFGAMIVDAADFLPQSRPRLFVVAVDASRPIPATCCASPARRFGPVEGARMRLPKALLDHWIDWHLPAPRVRNQHLIDVLETDLPASAWRNEAQTRDLIAQMDETNLARLAKMQGVGERRVGAVYRRTRMLNGEKRQRAEIRVDGLAGCLRTPGGGSSRQFLMICEDGKTRSRLITPRETARLMGLPDDYDLPPTATAACRVTGDGVAVPVVNWLNEHLLWPLVSAARQDVAA